jgi:endonuclease-8
LRRWIGGREVTAARSTKVPASKVVGSTVERVEARAKHLLIGFSNGLVLHTHMRMTGAWHVYPTGERWRKPAAQARVVLECGDRVAVCFNAPVVELLAEPEEQRHRVLTALGPDVLDPAFDPAEVVRRARLQPADRPVGEVLLDQRVVSGIGNIWRSESLFADRVNPFTPVGALDDDRLARLAATAARLMRASVTGHRSESVYGRTGRPCPRCGIGVTSRRLGEQARTAYWCPRCQPDPASEGTRS